VKKLLLFLICTLTSCSSFTKPENFTGIYNIYDNPNPLREEILELYITVPYTNEPKKTIYLHKYWDRNSLQWRTTTGEWFVRGKLQNRKIILWEWVPFPGDSTIYEKPEAEIYPHRVVNADIIIDDEHHLILVENFKGNSNLKFQHCFRFKEDTNE
jgi:hypothetical protein